MQHCVVCVCVCVCVCVHLLQITFEFLSILCVSFSIYIIKKQFIADNISVLMYIVCVILCLFSALILRVSALQISIIIRKPNNQSKLSFLRHFVILLPSPTFILFYRNSHGTVSVSFEVMSDGI